jgi:fucose 4-O-acetylase-like acetyltransferase
MISNSLGNPFVFFVSAVSGIVLVMLCSKLILPESRILAFIGRNTLAFLILHSVTPEITQRIFSSLTGHDACGAETRIGLKMIEVVVWVIGVYLMNRWAPWSVGRANCFSRFNEKTPLGSNAR